jgi:hypothetical protein
VAGSASCSRIATGSTTWSARWAASRARRSRRGPSAAVQPYLVAQSHKHREGVASRGALWPEAGFAGREAGLALGVPGREEGGSWGKHGFPHGREGGPWGKHGFPHASLGSQRRIGRGASSLAGGGRRRESASPLRVAMAIPQWVPGTRLYPLVPPLPVLLGSVTTGPPPFRGSASVSDAAVCRTAAEGWVNPRPRSSSSTGWGWVRAGPGTWTRARPSRMASPPVPRAARTRAARSSSPGRS